MSVIRRLVGILFTLLLVGATSAHAQMRNAKIAADGCPAALGIGGDDTSAVGCQVNWLGTHGGGSLFFPVGNYGFQWGGVIVPPHVNIIGDGFSSVLFALTDSTVLTFAANSSHRWADTFVVGWTGATPSQPAVVVQDNAEMFISRVRSWYGRVALLMRGNDGTIEQSFFWAPYAGVENYGSNWWRRVKMDGAVGHAQYGFKSGAGAIENYFEQCDFSGDFDFSVYMDPETLTVAEAKFTDCVMSSPIVFNNMAWVKIHGATLGGPVTATTGHLTLTDSFAFAPVTVSGGAVRHLGSNNVNIS